MFLSAPVPADPDYDTVLRYLDEDELAYTDHHLMHDLEELRPGNMLSDVYGHDDQRGNENDQYDYLECADLIGVLPMVVS